MNTPLSVQPISTPQFIVNIEDASLMKEIRHAIRMIKGVSAVRATTSANSISPSLSRRINLARHEYKNGETIICRTPEDMNRYFDRL